MWFKCSDNRWYGILLIDMKTYCEKSAPMSHKLKNFVNYTREYCLHNFIKMFEYKHIIHIKKQQNQYELSK